MITFIFGGKKEEPDYKTLIRNTGCVRVYRPSEAGDLKKFAAAITKSQEVIKHKDYYGKVVSEHLANDPMVVAVYEDELTDVNNILDKLKAFFLLAKDAGLEITLKAYQSQTGEELATELAKVK